MPGFFWVNVEIYEIFRCYLTHLGLYAEKPLVILGGTMGRRYGEYILVLCLGLGLALIASTALAQDVPPAARTCRFSREFITALEFLRAHPHFEVNEKQARQFAEQVAEGCTGAAQRFIRTFEYLNKVEAGVRVALQVGIEMARQSDAHVETFIEIFQHSYLQTHLDLDLQSSLKIARTLSTDYRGNVRVAAQDYVGLTQFCVDPKQVGLSIAQCATYAVQMAKAGEIYPGGVMREFKDFYGFLREQPTLAMNIGEALQVAEEVVGQGPVAIENFKLGYRYSLDEKGLGLTARQSLAKALEMAGRTAVRNEGEKNLRLPAAHPGQPQLKNPTEATLPAKVPPGEI